MIDLLVAAATVYILTAVIAVSSLFYCFREWVKPHTPWLKLAPDHPHFIECRLCLGAWVSLGVVWLTGLPFMWTIGVWGISYFMTTQER